MKRKFVCQKNFSKSRRTCCQFVGQINDVFHRVEFIFPRWRLTDSTTMSALKLLKNLRHEWRREKIFNFLLFFFNKLLCPSRSTFHRFLIDINHCKIPKCQRRSSPEDDESKRSIQKDKNDELERSDGRTIAKIFEKFFSNFHLVRSSLKVESNVVKLVYRRILFSNRSIDDTLEWDHRFQHNQRSSKSKNFVPMMKMTSLFLPKESFPKLSNYQNYI